MTVHVTNAMHTCSTKLCESMTGIEFEGGMREIWSCSLSRVNIL